jgi:hypothetical protein
MLVNAYRILIAAGQRSRAGESGFRAVLNVFKDVAQEVELAQVS